MKEFESDGLSKAKKIYLACPMCGERDWLKLRNVVAFDFNHGEKLSYFSIHCEQCKLTFGEIDGIPTYKNESELIADWNHRKY